MSKISSELKILFYLNDHASSNKFVQMRDLLFLLQDDKDICDRQIRRYITDLFMAGFSIETKRGPEGGYKLNEPLSNSFKISENVVLALAIATRKNQKVEKALFDIGAYVSCECVEGNTIDDIILNKLEEIVSYCIENREITFKYNQKEKLFIVQPYKVEYTNHGAYLWCVHDEVIKSFNVSKIENIKSLGKFKYSRKILEKVDNYIKNYFGVYSSDKEGSLTLKYNSDYGLKRLLALYEGKGIIDEEQHTISVKAFGKHILFIPLLGISTKEYEFINKEDKKEYITYLERVVNHLKNN